MQSPRQGKLLISLRVRKPGTKKRFTTRLFLNRKDYVDQIIPRLDAKYPCTELVVERYTILKRGI